MTLAQIVQWLIGPLIVALISGGYVALRKDRREAPKDRSSAIGDMLIITERSALTAAQALTAATEARAEAAQARADAASAQAELARQKEHADGQDARITAANERITVLRGHVQTWMRFGVILHDQWANLRLHLDPPPLPQFPTDDPSDY